MHDPCCTCSGHSVESEIERRIAAAVTANSQKLWLIRGIDARSAHAADAITLERLALNSGR